MDSIADKPGSADDALLQTSDVAPPLQVSLHADATRLLVAFSRYVRLIGQCVDSILVCVVCSRTRNDHDRTKDRKLSASEVMSGPRIIFGHAVTTKCHLLQGRGICLLGMFSVIPEMYLADRIFPGFLIICVVEM